MKKFNIYTSLANIIYLHMTSFGALPKPLQKYTFHFKLNVFDAKIKTKLNKVKQTDILYTLGPLYEEHLYIC